MSGQIRDRQRAAKPCTVSLKICTNAYMQPNKNIMAQNEELSDKYEMLMQWGYVEVVESREKSQ